MSDDRQAGWDAAGRAAANAVQDGARVGLGTGRAAAAGIRALGARVAQGLRCTGVATSEASAELAGSLGIPLDAMGAPVDLAFDGADVVTAEGLVVKGAGGAHVRERVVDQTAGTFLVLVDPPKLAASPDAWGVLPLAVVPFAAHFLAHELHDLRPEPRAALSDDGLVIIDLHPPAGTDWPALAAQVRAVPGVVDTGLFQVDPDRVLVGFPNGTVRTVHGLVVAGDFPG